MIKRNLKFYPAKGTDKLLVGEMFKSCRIIIFAYVRGKWMEKEITRYKILEWNINQASNRDRNNILPEMLIKELRLQNPDIIILTEFCFCSNAVEFLEEAFLQRNYEFYPTKETKNTENGQNEILIAWRKDIFKCDTENSQSEITTWRNNKPNYVRVLLTDRVTNKNIMVAGEESLWKKGFL